MKKLVSLTLLVCLTLLTKAQTELWVKGGGNSLYLEHKVEAKQGLYAIGRLYNVNPKFIASYNKMDMNAGLNIGQALRIPLTDTNFTQQGNSGTPVYYKANAESLQKISGANKNVAVTSLRDWNTLTTDNVKAGTKLVIGFLQSKEMPAVTLSTPQKKVETPVTTNPPVAEVKQPVKQEPKVVTPPVVKTEIKEEPKKVEVPEVKAVVKEELKALTVESGYFKNDFDKQVKAAPASKSTTVNSGIFRTSNGMQEAKYYLLIDGVSPGTIVKLTNPDNNKIVYAKVLGEMSGIRQNQGLDARISNTAASALDISSQDKFVVKVNY